MDKLPQMASVSDVRHRHLDVFEQAKAGPVVVSSRGKPVAVLVSPEQWNRIAEELEDLDDLIVALHCLTIHPGDVFCRHRAVVFAGVLESAPPRIGRGR